MGLPICSSLATYAGLVAKENIFQLRQTLFLTMSNIDPQLDSHLDLNLDSHLNSNLDLDLDPPAILIT